MTVKETAVRRPTRHAGAKTTCYSEETVESGPVATVVSATVNETKRFEEPVGIEKRKIDNSRSGTTAVRRMRAQRRWTRKCEIMFEEGIKQSESGELKISQVASFRADVEQAFRKGYLSAVEKEQIFEEEIEVTIPPRIAVDVVLHWKKSGRKV